MSENKQDTINVDLPIEAVADGRVSVLDIILSREYWSKVAATPDSALTDWTRVLAPAVVAWIERDEWKPLDLPEKGRTIKATLRDGSEETFEVKGVDDYGAGWVEVWKVDARREVRYIPLTIDAASRPPTDIIAWEYVDEPAESVLSAQDIRRMAHTLQCIVNDLGRVAK